jgi:hypothetical protein
MGVGSGLGFWLPDVKHEVIAQRLENSIQFTKGRSGPGCQQKQLDGKGYVTSELATKVPQRTPSNAWNLCNTISDYNCTCTGCIQALAVFC